MVKGRPKGTKNMPGHKKPGPKPRILTATPRRSAVNIDDVNLLRSWQFLLIFFVFIDLEHHIFLCFTKARDTCTRRR